jgi:basic membrane lipoprotein Med (substrate-binding protein (PBP1-ABC) superfamily)
MRRANAAFVIAAMVMILAWHGSAPAPVGTLAFPAIVGRGVPTAAVAQATKPARPFKVAYLPCGRINDQSWSQAGYEGVVAAQKELGIEFAYSESTSPADVEAAARDYASKGYKLVMLHCGTFTDAGLKAARDFPNTWFEITSANEVGKNVFSLNLQQQEGTFLAGAVAGLTTKSNRLGVVAAFNTLGFNRQIEGFRLGSRFVNPKTELFVTYINSVEDAAKAKEASLAQFDAGADVIMTATDQAATGVFQAAEERGKFVIAQYADQNALAPKVILFSLVYRQAELLTNVIRSVVNSTIKADILRPGVSEGVGTIIENRSLMARIPGEARDCLAALQRSFTDRKMKIPDDRVMGRQNAAKAIDPKSVVEGGAHPCLNRRA